MMANVDEAWQRYRRDGSRASFEVLFHATRPLVASVCRRVLLREQDVDDAVQQTYLRLVRHQEQVNGSPEAWLAGTARHVCLDLARADARRRRRRERLARGLAVDRAEAFRVEMARAKLPVAVAALDAADRELLRERYQQKVPLRVLAGRAGVGVSAMSRRVSAALDRLSQVLRDFGVADADALLIAQLFGDAARLEDAAGCAVAGHGLRFAADWRAALGKVAAAGPRLDGWHRRVRVGVVVSHRTMTEPYVNGVTFDGESQVGVTQLLDAGPLELVAVVERESADAGAVERTVREHALTGGLIDVGDAEALATLDVLIVGPNYRLRPSEVAAVHRAVSAGTGLLNDWWLNMHGLDAGDSAAQRALFMSASPVRMFHSTTCFETVPLRQVGRHAILPPVARPGLGAACGPIWKPRREATVVLEKGPIRSPIEHGIPGAGPLAMPSVVIGACGSGRVVFGHWRELQEAFGGFGPSLLLRLVEWLAEPRRGLEDAGGAGGGS